MEQNIGGKREIRGNPLRDIILGGQDGLVNALGILLGVIAATENKTVLFSTIIAASIAESISMGAVAYTSATAQQDFYTRELKKEAQGIEKDPEEKRRELKELYERKGIKGEALDKVVDAITSDKGIWLDTMAAEKLRGQPDDPRNLLKSSMIVTLATAVGHFIPALPFFFLTGTKALAVSLVVSGIALFSVGAYQALTLVGSWWKSALRMLTIGLGAAGVGYFLATIFT